MNSLIKLHAYSCPRSESNMAYYSYEKSLKLKSRKDRPHKIAWVKNEPVSNYTSKLAEFCRRTDLHGYKYIVMKDLNVVERSFWVLAVVLSIIFAVYFVVTAYKWYARNPIVTVIESTQGAIWDVPFPAVTICDLNLISRKAARRLADELLKPEGATADFIFESFRFVPLIHSVYAINDEQLQILQKLQVVLDFNNITIENLITQLSPAGACNKLVQRCMWKNTMYRCDQLFQPVYTVLSLCCTFNYFAIETSPLRNDTGMLQMTSPRRVASCGYQTALTVLLDTDLDDYYSATVASHGTLVFIDHAYNVPNLDSPVRMVNPSTEVLIGISPERTYTTPGVKAFTPEQRQCLYKDEVQIGDFQQYSFHNCMAYEKIKMIKIACGCVPLFFPLKDRIRTCSFSDLACMENVEINSNVSSEEKRDFKNYVFRCLPECEHYDYPLEVALGNLTKNNHLNGLPFFNDVVLKNHSLLNVFFNDLVSTRYRRDVYLNWQNILAAFGGLLSLMLGFTLISGFDLVLFITLRIFYDNLKSITSTRRQRTQSTAAVREHPEHKSHKEQTNKHGKRKHNKYGKQKANVQSDHYHHRY